jgi:hypothetical protein
LVDLRNAIATMAQRLKYGAALLALAAQNPEVHKTVLEAGNLLKTQSALREPELAERVTALMAPAA